MAGLDAANLGNLIFTARKQNDLTQKELAEQTGLAVKTIQDVEKGRKYPSYETLARLIARLGIPPDMAFACKNPISISAAQQFFEIVQSSDAEVHRILLKTVLFWSEELRSLEDKAD